MSRPILFLSDYGLDDEFVGVCHAVIAGIVPEARVIDLTHGVPPRDVARGAIVLADSVPYAPANAVYLAVVDPGVGTTRLPVAVQAGDAFLVGPDNGVLSLAWEALGGASRAFVIDSDEVMRTPTSPTFHGRDVFAPAAAHLASDGAPEALGRAVDPVRLERLRSPTATAEPGRLSCEVIGIDRFGNVQLSARVEDLGIADLDSATELNVRTGSEVVSIPRAHTFGDVPPERPGLIVDSSGRLAIVVNGGSAAETFDVQIGARVEVRASEP